MKQTGKTINPEKLFKRVKKMTREELESLAVLGMENSFYLIAELEAWLGAAKLNGMKNGVFPTV